MWVDLWFLKHEVLSEDRRAFFLTEGRIEEPFGRRKTSVLGMPKTVKTRSEEVASGMCLG